MKALDAVRKRPVTVGRGATVAEVAGLMDRLVVGAVVVVEDDRPVGIVTDRDLVVRGLARNLAPDGRVDSVMSTEVITLGATTDVREAVRVFEHHAFRRLPLVDDGRMVGMLTVDDLLVDEVGDLSALVRAVTGQVIFGHPEPGEVVERR